MTKPDSKQPKKKEEAPKGLREEREKATGEGKIDFAKLDLTIEKVEERINPSETNVFDK